jgi:hypothetical protein
VNRGSSRLDGVTGRRVCFLLWGEPGLRWVLGLGMMAISLAEMGARSTLEWTAVRVALTV